jgi:hypothetical protein
MLRSADVTKFRFFGPRCLAEQPAISLQEPAPATAPRTATQSAMALLEPGRSSRSYQTEKNSVRAYVFRFALELGHCSTQSACLKCANSGIRESYSITWLVRQPVAVMFAPGICPNAHILLELEIDQPVTSHRQWPLRASACA